MAWRIARALETLRDQVNVMVPHRDKSSDGSIGDAAHASRSSDHNPWVQDGGTGVVTAIDITHDPKGGFDSYVFAEILRRNRDPRIKYVISNRKIFSSVQNPWEWRPYNGANPHDHHVHISVSSNRGLYDSTVPWKLDLLPGPVPHDGKIEPEPKPVLRLGSSGDLVIYVQRMLGVNPADGRFNDGTEHAVIEFQKRYGLVPDGVVGPYTWRQLEE